jgi:hypothetical protein
VATTTSADECILRERRPNVGNKTELLDLMGRTHDERRQWINCTKPSITEILQRYPRFQDVNEAVSIKIIFNEAY